MSTQSNQPKHAADQARKQMQADRDAAAARGDQAEVQRLDAELAKGDTEQTK